MQTIFLQALGFLLIIIAGYLLKRFQLLKKSDGHILAVIIMNLTLPAAIIIGLTGISVSVNFFLLILTGFILNFILVIVGKYIGRKETTLDHTLLMYSISGYNIGNFTLPFIQGFFPLAIPFICMFDIGNCLMIAGGTTIIVDHETKTNVKAPSPRTICLKLLKSVPFVTYLIMVCFKLVHFEIPTEGLKLIQLFANANGFLSMFMIGLYLELKLPKKDLVTVIKILTTRYIFAVLTAALFYFVIPFPPVIKTILVLVSLAPIPTFAIINSVASGVREEVAGFISSLSIIISLILMTSAMLFLI